MVVELAAIAVTIAVVLMMTVYTALTGISPLPTTATGQALILGALPEEPRTIVEAGSGWGGVALSVARARPGAQVLGYELSPLPWAFSHLRRLIQPAPNVRFYRRNLLRASFREVDVVVCYLHMRAVQDLEPKLRAELPEGAVVISNTFQIPGWQPSEVRQPPSRLDAAVYVYRVPAAYQHVVDVCG